VQNEWQCELTILTPAAQRSQALVADKCFNVVARDAHHGEAQRAAEGSPCSVTAAPFEQTSTSHVKVQQLQTEVKEGQQTRIDMWSIIGNASRPP
jgi:hypothetical protein